MSTTHEAVLIDPSTNQIIGVVYSSPGLLHHIYNPWTLVEITDDAVKDDIQKFFLKDGMLVRKPEVTMTPNKTKIQADGIDTCIISFSPPMSLVVAVNGETVEIPPGETLEITSETMQKILVELVSSTHYATSCKIQAV